MKILPSFTHFHVNVPNKNDFLSSVEHKRRYFEECACLSFPCNYNECEASKTIKRTIKLVHLTCAIALVEKQTNLTVNTLF